MKKILISTTLLFVLSSNATDVVGYQGIVKKDANVRASTNLNSKKIMVLKENQEVYVQDKVYSKNGTWFKVDKGYISAELIELKMTQEKKEEYIPKKQVKIIAPESKTETAKNEVVKLNPVAKRCKIDFSDLVKTSLDKHPSILMSKSMINSANFQLESSKWGLYPTPNLEYSHKNSDKYQTVFTLEQPIWAGGKIRAEIDKASAQKDESIATLEEAKFKLIDTYLKTFKDYLQSKNKISIIEDNFEEYENISQTFQRMIKAGILSQADKNLFDSKIASLMSEKIVTNSKFDVSKMKFEILSDKTINCDIAYKFKPSFNENTNINDLVLKLEKFHPSLSILNSKLKTSKEELSIAKSTFMPKFSIKAEHRNGGLYETSDNENENLAYATVSLNFGSGLSSLSNVQKAKADINKIKLEVLTKKKELVDLLINDYMSFIKTKEHTKILLNDLWTATQIYHSNKRLFESQKKTWLDVVNSLSELNKQKIQYEELLIEQNILKYQIALKSGLINIDNFEVISE